MPQIHVAYIGSADDGIVDEFRGVGEARGVGKRLHFVPPVPLRELVGYIGEADLSLIMYGGAGSRDNAFAMPNKLFDSLAAGVPGHRTRGHHLRGICRSRGSGRVFRLGEPGRLAAAARDLLTNPETTRRARLRAGEFTWTSIEPALLALVDEVAGSGGD